MKPKVQEGSKRSVKITAIVIAVMVSFALFEGVARIAYEFRDDLKTVAITLARDNIIASLRLDPYEMPATDIPGHWRLRPGFSATNEEIAKAKQNAGKFLGVRVLRNTVNRKATQKNRLQINSMGFTGPELNLQNGRIRVLMLGDSVTFGYGSVSYPRMAEKRLRETGLPIDVINGGVEGYSPKNALYEIDRYLALKPDVVTVYLGWNALFSENIYGRWLRSLWLIRRVWYLLTVLTEDPETRAKMLYGRALTPDLQAAKRLVEDDFVPSFMGDMKTLTDRFSEKGIKVVIITLPGLFSTSEAPTEKALRKGHLPEFTTNPYVLARLSEQYNIALKKLARESGVSIIDLEKWSSKSLQPRDEYFSDSVHLTSQGLAKVGQKIAVDLLPLIKKQTKNRAPAQ